MCTVPGYEKKGTAQAQFASKDIAGSKIERNMWFGFEARFTLKLGKLSRG